MKIIFIIIVLASFIMSKEIDKSFNESFKAEKGTVLILEHGDGDVEVTTWQKDDLEIAVRYKAEVSGSNSVKDFDVKFKSYGDKIYVTGTEYRDNFFNFGSSYTHHIEYVYEIKAPEYIELDISGDDGSVFIENLTGNLRITVDDGNINLKNISNNKTDIRIKDGRLDISKLESELYISADDGDMFLEDLSLQSGEIDTQDGRIKIISASGPLYLSSDDGDIILDAISSSEVKVRTEDGDVDLEFVAGKIEDFNIRTKDGRVRIYIKEKIDAYVDITTDDGRIRFDVNGAEIIRESRDQIRAQLGDGSGKIQISTNDGSITLSSD